MPTLTNQKIGILVNTQPTTFHIAIYRFTLQLGVAAILMLSIDALCVAPKSLYAQNGCIPAYSSRLRAGDHAYVLPNPLGPNLVRNLPSKQAVKIGQIAINEEITLIDGPQCADGWLWWYVRIDNGVFGWTSEGQAGEYWLAPGSNQNPINNAASRMLTAYIDCHDDKQLSKVAVSVHNRLVVGGYAIVLGGVTPGVNLYESENYDKWIGKLPDDSYLYVMDGPRCVQGKSNNYYQRWLVQDLRTGLMGWTSEGGRDTDGQIHYWLAPDNLYSACTGYLSRIKDGDMVYMTWQIPLDLHVSPSRSSATITSKQLQPKKIVRVVGGPECADGWTFWLLDVDGGRYYASEGDPNNPSKGYWLVPVVNNNVSDWRFPVEANYSVPVNVFFSFQNAINNQDYVYAYNLLSDFFKKDLCDRVKVCTVQQFGNGYKLKESETISDIRNEHQGKITNLWIFDVALYSDITATTTEKTICMLYKTDHWEVHGIFPLGREKCG